MAPSPAGPYQPARDTPTIMAGYDAFRQWDRWPYLHIGERAYMLSTYDRAGGNEGADASHYLRLDDGGRAVPLDVQGPGMLQFVRTNHWHGSPWHYVVDGTDHVIEESSAPGSAKGGGAASFVPTKLFPSPLVLTWQTTQGADLSWVPIPFEHSLTLQYEHTHYGTGYYILHRYPEGADNLSHPIRAWDASPPPEEVLDLLESSGDDLSPSGAGANSVDSSLTLGAGVAIGIADLTGSSEIRALRFSVPKAQAIAFSKVRLQITWDDQAAPSIDAPIALFFGAGSLYNRNDAEWLVRALPMGIHFESDTVTLATYFPMPFFRHAKIELIGGDTAVTGIAFHVTTEPYTDPQNWVGYLHATYVDHGTPVAGNDLVLLDTTKVEGGGDVCGSVVGTSVIFSDHANLTTLEGDPRFFFDDSLTPQVQGTGSEEWGGGGDYWNGLTTTLPLAGHPVGAPSSAAAKSADDQIESLYRFLLSDAMPFGKNARIQLEHGGADDSTEHYQSVTYWYGLPGACLTKSDTLHVGDPNDEAAHSYSSPTASAPETLTTRYDWGIDHIGDKEVYPATSDTGRHMTGSSEFTLAIKPSNLGVLLRRKLDYGYADQRAEVYVADDVGKPFQHAGTWYLAGSNRCVYSNAAGELDPPTPVEQTSNRRWREDEFLIGRSLTSGRSSVRIRIDFTPAPHPLQPGETPPPSAWSEFRYDAYVWSLPALDRT